MTVEYFGLDKLINKDHSLPIDIVISDNLDYIRQTIKNRLFLAGLDETLREETVNKRHFVIGEIVYDNYKLHGLIFPTWAVGVKDND